MQVADGMYRGGPGDAVRAALREPDVADVAGVDELLDGADGLLDGHVRIHARRPVDVDVVGAEAAQRVGQRGLDRLRAGVVAEPMALDRALRAELHADGD